MFDIAGADPGILVRGWIFFFNGMGSGGALRSPVGPGQRWGPREAPEF